MKKIVFSIAALMVAGYAFAQDNTQPLTELVPAQPIQPAAPAEEKIEVKPSGRILMDAGVFGADAQKDKFCKWGSHTRCAYGLRSALWQLEGKD
ncbi:hypothetical protein [Capnocytophaga sp. oral taxon 878]|uniref:hypothetical protein n=1 Tax=Capnocytophaga sp. oral taxon 878 TaxID=1316596 RepID=UPI0020C1E592|nr:hypothetical protein [Capnocytophaga sp. oral taxon 878]